MRTGGRRRGTAKNSERTGCGASRGDRWVVGYRPRVGRAPETSARDASGRVLRYLISTLAPASSSCALIWSASSWATPSLTGLGAPSTRSLASFRPRPVTARTTLIAWIFLSPALISTTSKDDFSSAAAPSPPPPAGAPAAATAIGAAAVTPHSSSSLFFSSTRSRTDMPPRSCTSLSVSVLAILLFLLWFGRSLLGLCRRLFGLLFLGCFLFLLRLLGRFLGLCRRFLGGRLGLRDRLALLLELADPCLQHAHQVPQRRGEQADDGRERRGHGADQLRPQHVGGRQRGESLDLLVADDVALEHAAADHEHVVRAGGLAQHLGDGDRVALGLEERDRGRALDQLEHVRRARGLGSAPGERVLDDREARADLEQLAAQLVDLGHRQAAVVGDHQGLARAQALGQLLDDSLFLGFQHVISSGND